MLRFLIAILLTVSYAIVSAQEICDNGIDDDNDGLVDLNDPDCECAGFESSQTVPSLIPNSSFEDHSCCPNGYSQLNCADTWIQASGPTSDFWHSCGNATSTYGSPGPNPDGNGIAGFINWDGYKEYVGACLLSPMLVGNTYTLSFYLGFAPGSVPLDITFYGSPNCGDLPFGSGCPIGQGSWMQLATLTASGPGWVNLQVTFVPTVDINALVIGPGCPAGPANINYYYVDGLTLAETSAFGSTTITESGSFCTDDLTLNASIDTTGGTWQWYFEGVALSGQTDASLDISGNNLSTGTYQAVYTHGIKCETGEYVLNLPDLPVANFTSSQVCQGEATVFTDVSAVASGSITGWEWDFDGDGTIDASSSSPSYTFPSYGTYNTELIVTSDIGCKDSITAGTGANNAAQVEVFPLPISNPSVDQVCFNVANSFVDNSTVPTGTIVAWSWDFGDGSSLNINQNPSYLYSTFGDFNVNLTVTTDHSCSASESITAHVYELPVANFDLIDVCDEDPYNFQDASSSNEGTLVSWQWDFENDAVFDDFNQNTSHLYSTYGVYDVSLVVESSFACFDTITQSITILQLPTADFNSSFECQGYASQFTDLSVGNSAVLVSWQWDFESDQIVDNTSQNPTFVYSSPGTYTSELTVTDANGCSEKMVNTVVVNPNPLVNFEWNPVCDGDEMSFLDQSTIATGSNTSWSWDFAGLAASIGQSAGYTFPNDGFFSVQLTVVSDSSCTDSLTQQIEVWSRPTADFQYSNVCDEETAVFVNASQGNGGTIDIVEYDFYTNGVVDQSGFDAAHIYPYSGSFFVSQYVQTTDGCRDTITQEIVVFPKPEVNFTMNPECEENNVLFTNNSSISDGTSLDYFWDFGNGNTAVTQNPSEFYGNAGIYLVTLTATSNQGCVEMLSDNLDVYPKPVPNFIPNNVCDGQLASFVDFSSITNVGTSDQITNWSWNLGVSPTVSTSGQFPTYLYPTFGTYSVTLITTTNHNCVDSITKDIVIHPNPVVQFSSPNPEGCATWCSNFIDESTIPTGNLTQYFWNFGNGNVSTDQNPSDCFVNTDLVNQTYDITLSTTSDMGCQTSLTKPAFITVYPIPVADFEPSSYETSIYQTTIDFEDQSLIAEEYFWTFDSLGYSSQSSPSFFFPDSDSGRYEVCQFVESQYGCKDTICKEIIINGFYNVYVPSAFTPNNDGVNDVFIPSLFGVIEYEFSFVIFDRWGQLIYESSDPNFVEWDGSFQGEQVQQDVYVWKLECYDKYQNKQIHMRGHVSVLR